MNLHYSELFYSTNVFAGYKFIFIPIWKEKVAKNIAQKIANLFIMNIFKTFFYVFHFVMDVKSKEDLACKEIQITDACIDCAFDGYFYNVMLQRKPLTWRKIDPKGVNFILIPFFLLHNTANLLMFFHYTLTVFHRCGEMTINFVSADSHNILEPEVVPTSFKITMS